MYTPDCPQPGAAPGPQWRRRGPFATAVPGASAWCARPCPRAVLRWSCTPAGKALPRSYGRRVRLLAAGGKLPPVIAASGLGRDALAALRTARAEKLFACLAKPVPPAMLIEVVKAAIGQG